MDMGDKATNKAMAIAYKYLCFQIFCIPTEEMSDPDAESLETELKAEKKEELLLGSIAPDAVHYLPDYTSVYKCRSLFLYRE